MATYKLAVIINNPLNDAEFLLVRQTRPPKFSDDEYDSYVDSDLWDLPWTPLNLVDGENESTVEVKGAESFSEKIELRNFDINLALNRIKDQVVFGAAELGDWKLRKYVEEAEFGPAPLVQTVFVDGNLVAGGEHLQESCKWMSIQSCLNWLVEVTPSNDRVGPLAVTGLLNDSSPSRPWKVPHQLNYQEYPPGVTLVPMQSRTGKPFSTTNLIVFAPDCPSYYSEDISFVASGDAMIVDPGCHSYLHEELKNIVASLPKKLVVFLTHHHHDHVDGLSAVQQCNPDAVLLAHENTFRRIGKDDWSLGYTSISGGEDICIGGQRLNVVFSPGHTDGHMALLHVSTHSLIVGDHCVGQGSALLDVTSGGNMTEYFKSTYKFMELSPHALIPMHGRVNLWPKHMLCGYLKNRRSRETAIVKAIENGAETLFDIVANVYSEVDRRVWGYAASNVRLHVDHLAQQDKLPKEFSIQKFQKTCGLRFLSRWVCAILTNSFMSNYHKLRTSKLLVVSAVAVFALFYSVKNA
ncbi:uncharacterized protein LOC133821928 isoform X1 [Humulus lupulus]|uniref:uncharacterized protein LOC133821928 isoform X1 n=1 Tax=Humulus lupulus TaxID=3486 RepID=UPI002B405DC9|nr:uncharacterized protein LOC133821928 isoform X1 [Humulus lupulus]